MMKHQVIMLFLALMFTTQIPAITPQSLESADASYQKGLQHITTMWHSLKGLHPAWEKLYPVCIAHGDNYYLYVATPQGDWSLEQIVNRPGQVPQEIRAAYPLDFADNQIACVIDPSVFEDQKQMIIVFHEFVHCYQFNTCEAEIKGSLEVCRAEMMKQNWMWELNYDFPYNDRKVAKTYLAMIKAARQGKSDRVRKLRSQLRSMISEQDWEYLTWQEFKEGTARYLENELNARYGYRLSTSSSKQPLNRVIFYEGGERMIRLLIKANPSVATDLPLLWHALRYE